MAPTDDQATLLIYLSDEEMTFCSTGLGSSLHPSSRLALAHHSRAGLDQLRASLQGQRGQIASDVQSLWRSGLREDPTAWLARHGWRAAVYDPAERAEHYGRPLEATRDRIPGASTWFITAQRDRDTVGP